MKTKEELEQIKEEYTNLTKRLAELNAEELTQVSGGDIGYPIIVPDSAIECNICHKRVTPELYKAHMKMFHGLG